MDRQGNQSVTPATDRGHDDPPAQPQDALPVYPPRQKVCRFPIRVEQGKSLLSRRRGGKKDRYVILSPVLLEILHEGWCVARKKSWMSPGQPWLFPGYRGQHTSARQLHRIVRLAAGRAGITKQVGVHTLRHCFATHLLEQKTDIRIIQVLLGHKKLDTTALYTRVAIHTIGQVTSPLGFLRQLPG